MSISEGIASVNQHHVAIGYNHLMSMDKVHRGHVYEQTIKQICLCATDQFDGITAEFMVTQLTICQKDYKDMNHKERL